jgi:hypothetical protein
MVFLLVTAVRPRRTRGRVRGYLRGGSLEKGSEGLRRRPPLQVACLGSQRHLLAWKSGKAFVDVLGSSSTASISLPGTAASMRSWTMAANDPTLRVEPRGKVPSLLIG